MQKLISYNYLYLIPLLLSAIFSLKSFRLKWPIAFRMFSVFLLSTLAIEIFAIAWKWYLYNTSYWRFSRSNLWIYNAFVCARHLFVLFFFYQVIHSDLIKTFIKFSLLPFIIFSLVNYTIIQKPDGVNYYTIAVSNILIIFLCLFFFRQILKDTKLIKLNESTEVWISLGAFIYYSGTLPFFILFDYLIKEQPDMAASYLYINDSLNIIMYLFYLISFLCKPHSLKSPLLRL